VSQTDGPVTSIQGQLDVSITNSSTGQGQGAASSAGGGTLGDATSGDTSTTPDIVKTGAGTIVSTFAAVIGFIGIKSTELTSILRNDENAALIVFCALVFAVTAGLLAVFVTKARTARGSLLGGLALIASGYAFVIVSIRSADGSGKLSVGWATFVTIAPLALAFGLVAVSVLPTSAIHRLHKVLEGKWLKSVFGGKWLKSVGRASVNWLKTDIEMHAWLVMFSVFLLSLSVLGSIRIEGEFQKKNDVQLVASINQATTSGTDGTITVNFTAERLRLDDWGTVVICGVVPATASTSLTSLTSDASSACISTAGSTPVACASSDNAGGSCQVLALWRVRPDSTGSISQKFVVPVHGHDYSVLEGHAFIGSGLLVSRAGFRLLLPT